MKEIEETVISTLTSTISVVQQISHDLTWKVSKG
jgi:hypothetical protein